MQDGLRGLCLWPREGSPDTARRRGTGAPSRARWFLKSGVGITGDDGAGSTRLSAKETFALDTSSRANRKGWKEIQEHKQHLMTHIPGLIKPQSGKGSRNGRAPCPPSLRPA
ncbi:hypothetical protein KIL84_021606 [Mauremys mutica]|uniref:Uncharacterized protein n=1 Tax=Mauremys mutica TaxID=74926 RepID=A0A9D3X802_9SAUR|nr:hypothetical protein KIL84_021606 [Mauremys mutica]